MGTAMRFMLENPCAGSIVVHEKGLTREYRKAETHELLVIFV